MHLQKFVSFGPFSHQTKLQAILAYHEIYDVAVNLQRECFPAELARNRALGQSRFLLEVSLLHSGPIVPRNIFRHCFPSLE